MINVPRVALAVGGGYLLGRTRKLKFAIAVGGVVTGRKLPTSATDLLRMGAQYLAGSPELTRLRDAIRDQLLVAGRNAALAAAGHQIEVLTGVLTARLELLEATPTAIEPPTIEPAVKRRSAVEPITASVPGDVGGPEDEIETEYPGLTRAARQSFITEGASA